MKSFTDNQGRTWGIVINVDAIKRVRSLLQIDLLGIVEGKLVEELIRDPVKLCDVVYVLCKPEADARSISDEDFGRAMAGDAIDNATTALLEELVDFFPSPRDRANLQKVLRLTWKMMDKAREVIEQRLSSGEIEKEAEQVLVNVGGLSSTVPELSVSTQEPLR